jgi:hypothetical protein
MPLTFPGPAAPYSAVQESSSVQTLADGTHIEHKSMIEKIYRDSEERTRTERAFCHGPGGTGEAMVIEIRDPVSGYSYILDEQNQVAHRFAIQVRHPSDSAVRTANIVPAQTTRSAEVSSQESARPTVTTGPLGTQTMEGVLVEGKRTTRLTNIELSNPILSLFQAPADYKIVDETDYVFSRFVALKP